MTIYYKKKTSLLKYKATIKILPYQCFAQFLFLAWMSNTHLSIHQWSVLFHPAACHRSEVEAKGKREHNSPTLLPNVTPTVQNSSDDCARAHCNALKFASLKMCEWKEKKKSQQFCT